MKFEELEDARWSRIEPLLPPRAREGKPRADDRSIVNGILFVLVTGCRGIDMPKRIGDDSTANRRYTLCPHRFPSLYTVPGRECDKELRNATPRRSCFVCVVTALKPGSLYQ
jgi:transposase